MVLLCLGRDGHPGNETEAIRKQFSLVMAQKPLAKESMRRNAIEIRTCPRASAACVRWII